MDERERLDVDVAIVGGGPAGLATAIAFRKLAIAAGRDDSVVVLEKGGEIGHHAISGAVVDPRALDELLPDWRETAPIEAPVSTERLWFLTRTGRTAIPLALVPPALHNGGKVVASLQKLTAWLGGVAEAHGVDVLPTFAAQELLWDGERAVGVRVGDKGVDRHGARKANFEPGPDVYAKIVVLAEGARGTLAKVASRKLGLDEASDPQTYAIGVKELWQCPPGRVEPGSVLHTLGHPLPSETFGGGFVYGLGNDVLDIGMVTGLDARDPTTDGHDNLQRLKSHPAIAELLEGATLLRYGAKAIPEGGLYAMPRPYADGLLLVGDTAGFLDGMRLKGIHLAIASGSLAGRSAFDAIVADDTSGARLAAYRTAFERSWAYDELHRARNVHQGFKRGLFAGLLNAGLAAYAGGRAFGVIDRLAAGAGYAEMEPLARRVPVASTQRSQPSDAFAIDKLADVYASGTMHDEDQVGHLHVADTSVCAERCTTEYGNPCRYFCPANVYEPLFAATRAADGSTVVDGRLQINFTNCVHCKTCDIVDPYQIITWVPPQGGEGPVYAGM